MRPAQCEQPLPQASSPNTLGVIKLHQQTDKLTFISHSSFFSVTPRQRYKMRINSHGKRRPTPTPMHRKSHLSVSFRFLAAFRFIFSLLSFLVLCIFQCSQVRQFGSREAPGAPIPSRSSGPRAFPIGPWATKTRGSWRLFSRPPLPG